MKRLPLLFLMLTAWLCAQAQYARLTNLPAIRIFTSDGRGITSKEYYKYCTMYYTDEQDNVTRYDSVQVRGRGNSTWNLSKKPYRIKFNHKEKFLGKGYANAKSWTLLANAGDKSLIRNAVTSAMGKRLGMKFNPAYKFVDLYLDGQYLGNYQISDQVQVRPHRVNIVEQEEVPTDTSDITGGYLLELDRSYDFSMGKTGFMTSHYQLPINIHSPEEEVIAQSQLLYISAYVDEFERRLQSDQFTDRVEGYRPMVDSTSLVNWYLGNEMSANVDGFYSTYFYKDRDDSLLYWGPLWDFDIAYNNDNRTDRATTNNTTEQMMADVAYRGSKVWVQRMWEDPWFGRLVNRRFKEAVDGGMEAYLHTVVDSLSSLLEESQEQNYRLWGINKRAYHEVVVYSTYDQYIADLKQFITDHLNYLSRELPMRTAKGPAEPTPEFKPGNYYYRIASARTGHVIDVSNGQVVANANDSADIVQDWYFKQSGGRFQIINRQSGLALNDPTEGAVTATTNVGTQLNVAMADDSDTRQLWTLTPQGYSGHYNLINVATRHAANLSGGRSDADAPVVSYTSDSRDSVSQNRLWKFTATDTLSDSPTGLAALSEPEDYALAYNPMTQELHFGSATPQQLTFMAEVFTVGGAKVGQFRADQRLSMQGWPKGVYVVRWLNHSRKFQK